MNRYICPQALSRYQTEPEQALSLAGSDMVSFARVISRSRDGRSELLDLRDLDAATLHRLSHVRPDICGLTMDQPRIMGILNVTPDSFSDGGAFGSVNDAVARAKLIAKDADILDIGGESTRPGADDVSIAEEIRRTAPVIRAIRDSGLTLPISIDTRKAKVAEAAIAAGANMVNDVTALCYDPDMAAVVAATDVAVCLMHAQGEPKTMQDAPRYENVVFDVADHLARRITAAIDAGVSKTRLIIDPGIGFGKNMTHNVLLLRELAVYHDLGVSVLLGASRKRFIGTITGADIASDRLAGSLTVALHGFAQAVQIVRVHDTLETRQALRLQRTLSGAGDYG